MLTLVREGEELDIRLKAHLEKVNEAIKTFNWEMDAAWEIVQTEMNELLVAFNNARNFFKLYWSDDHQLSCYLPDKPLDVAKAEAVVPIKNVLYEEDAEELQQLLNFEHE